MSHCFHKSDGVGIYPETKEPESFNAWLLQEGSDLSFEEILQGGRDKCLPLNIRCDFHVFKKVIHSCLRAEIFTAVSLVLKLTTVKISAL